MNEKQFISWLGDVGILDFVRDNYGVFTSLIKDRLKANDEEFLIIGDKGYKNRRIPPIMAGCYLLAAKKLNIDYKFVIQEPKQRGEIADENVIDSLKNLDKKNIIALSLSERLGSLKSLGKSYRKFALKRHHKFISSPGMSCFLTNQMSSLINCINTDYSLIQEKGNYLKEIFDDAKEIRVMTRNGTDITFDVSRRKSVLNTGNFEQFSSGGNIPAGEVFIPPKENKTSGRVVIDGSIKTISGTIIPKDPLHMTIEKGEVTDLSNCKEAILLEQSLEWARRRTKKPLGVRKIGELGIGINPKASIIGPTLVNEKSLGTAHIAIGSNYWFGGRNHAIIHLDQVFKNPVFEVDGVPVRVS